MSDSLCYHCGDSCDTTPIQFDEKIFCCSGCKTVYEIFTDNDLTCYYDLEQTPGSTPVDIKGKYDYLDSNEIIHKLLDFTDETTQVVTLYIPKIHCSSCIWILENLHKLKSEIKNSQIDFPKKTVRITYDAVNFSLKEVVLQLSSIGYEPYISLDDHATIKKSIDRSLYYKLGVAGFAFGNVMFLSFPEYFEVSEFWLDQYKYVFRYLMLAFSIPVVFYAGQEYLVSAYKGIRAGVLNIDIPIALGIIVLFTRSTVEILMDWGTGFFDSLTGLIFFLLLGKFFQQKTYSFLSFERDYKSYFPIAVTRITSDRYKKEETIQIYDIKKGDRLLIRNHELIPVDSILIEGDGQIDYSFVTGESNLVHKELGDSLFAGGRQSAGALQIEALESVEQSYLTQLWSNDVFNQDKDSRYTNITDTVSKYFTITILMIACIATAYWIYADASQAAQVCTAILIIACPCALALARPFALGNMLRIFGKQGFFLKNSTVIERLSQLDTLVFDKTGTMTTNTGDAVFYTGKDLNADQSVLLNTALRASNHPLSRSLYAALNANEVVSLDAYKEYPGAGIEAIYKDIILRIGSASFTGVQTSYSHLDTTVHIAIDQDYKGHYTFHNTYRQGLSTLFSKLIGTHRLFILSGDNAGEASYLKRLLPTGIQTYFDQRPKDKLDFIQKQQQEGKKVGMIGDGLNDAGALAQSDVGIAISEDIAVFSPACDAIMDAAQFDRIDYFTSLSKKTITIIKSSIILSFLYNIVGLYFAVTGQLSPLIAAILMPLSSISVLVYVTLLTNWVAKKRIKIRPVAPLENHKKSFSFNS
ncbi:heavy metal translocating P-type ATPase [Aquimarina intermedia]|uniref:Cu+-exporting ATPase n=1 Tax=Aquimarina intermedia TaxID=350814 RepID=A0A5S5C4B6_9FLAO|nr:heavy metal translocating P-type ATPase metal-binding domain-containing protein [Aquimarina intermedia]TYP74261.1 Cu+-exporting ATPase [Aquimarina intermedia]